jgi:hypothetical protein
MRAKAIAAAACAGFVAICGASGAWGAPACRDTGSAAVTDVWFDTSDQTVVKGLAVSLQLGLSPASSPSEDVEKNRDACRRGEFSVGKDHWEIFGDDKDSPPRWAIGPDRKRIVYLAIVPDPIEAAAWSDKSRVDPKLPADFKKALYVVAVAEGDRRLIHHFSRVIPDDYHLAGYFKAALAPDAKPLAVYDAKTGQADLGGLDAAQAPVNSGNKGGELLRLTSPDGTYFIPLSDGSARHTPSGFVCPVKIGKFERKDMSVLNPADGGRDVMCRYFSDKSWFSVFDTRFDDGTLEEVFAGYLKEAQGQTPVASTLPPPGDVKVDLPVKSAFWLGQEGARQGMWVARKGAWYIEVRVTYVAGDETAVAAFAQTMFDLLSKPGG